MTFRETPLAGAYVIGLNKLEDDRGFFGRTYCVNEFREKNLELQILQSNISFNRKRGTLRGMHMQTAPNGEIKLVRCTRGSIFDVIVDLRKDSGTYLQWFGIELTADSYEALYIPKDFAHGFLTLQDNTEVEYQMGEFFVPGSAVAFHWQDPTFNIQWPFAPLIISKKDMDNPNFATN
jgi:dTDP-4-dehydrorhamnose 3,5-epimerase